VQFVFGGDSRFVVGAAKAELCGTYQTTAPPIAVYGLSSGAETRVPATGATTTRLTAPGAATRFNPATVPAATTVDGAYATWVDTTAGSAARTGSFSATGYAPVAPIPAGSVVDVATLRVVHGNTAGVNTDVKTVTVKVAGGAPITVTLPSYNDGLMHTDTVNLLTTSGAAFPNEVHSRGYTGATITYAATVKHSGTERVDAVELDLAYRAPAFRGGSGCVTQTPYTGTGSGPCPLILSTNSPGTQFYVQGTTYAPRAALDIALNNVSGQVFKFGVVSRTLRVNVTGSSSFTEAVIQVPDDSPGYGLTPNVGIYLRTYVCAGSGPCPTTGTEALRAKVRLEDDPGTAITAGRRKVVIETWAGSR
jgi:hypothetical protein